MTCSLWTACAYNCKLVLPDITAASDKSADSSSVLSYVLHACQHCFGAVASASRIISKTLRDSSWCTRLEPAGSHGVWGLDDYQFMPFIWGSSQLNGHTTITPSSIHSQSILDTNAADYLYLGCIKFVKQVQHM